MKKTCAIILLSLVVWAGYGRPKTSTAGKVLPARGKVKAFYTSSPVKIDGKLDDTVWQKAESYSMGLSADKGNRKLIEGARLKFAWDENYFYLAADLDDTDLVAENGQDQQEHYRFGDVCELFLKPVNHSWYWELYVTPRSNKTTFFYPSRGYVGLKSCFTNYPSGLKVAAVASGTINNWHDKDGGWTAEMAMPVKDLTARGEKFGPGSKWTLLVGRYNYNYYFNEKELSVFPKISIMRFHLTDQFAEINFVK